MKNFIKKISSVAATVALLLSMGAGVSYVSMAAASTLRVVQTPAIHLYSGISGSATSARITPYPKDLDGNKLTITDFGTNPTFTVDPKILNVEEIISFTGITDNGDNTATLTGLTRDLTSKYPYTTAGTGRSHGGGATVVFGNNPQVYGRLAALENIQTWTAVQTFGSTTQPAYDGNPSSWTSGLSFIDKAYADALSIQGAATSTYANMGIVWLASASQAAAGTASSTTGAPLVLPSNLASSTYNGGSVFQGEIVTLRSTKDIDPNFIATSSGNTYNFGGPVTLATSTIGSLNVGTINATSSILLNGAGVLKFGGSGVNGALSISSGTTTINLLDKNIFTLNYTSISITGTGALAFSNPNPQGTVIILKSQGNVTISASDAIDASGMGSLSGNNGFVFFGNSFATTTAVAGGGTSCSPSCTAAGGGGGGNNTATSSAILDDLSLRTINLAVGTAGGNNEEGTAGGRGGGALYIEVGGSWNFTGSISVAGLAGANGASNVSGSGGGGGGSLLAIYNSLVANTGTFIITGGVGGSSNNGGAAGGVAGNSSTTFGSGFGGAGGSASGGGGTVHSGGGGGGSFFQTANGSAGSASSQIGSGGGGASGIATTTLNYFFQ